VEAGGETLKQQLYLKLFFFKSQTCSGTHHDYKKCVFLIYRSKQGQVLLFKQKTEKQSQKIQNMFFVHLFFHKVLL